MKFEDKQFAYKDLSLLDTLINFKMSSQEFIKSEKVVEGLAKIVDDIKAIDYGYILASIVRGNERALLLIISNNNAYEIYSWKQKEVIEKPLQVIVHEKKKTTENNSISELIRDNAGWNSILRDEEVVSGSLVESLNGYSLNVDRLLDLCEYSKLDTSEHLKTSDLNDRVKELNLQDIKSIGTKSITYMCDTIKSTLETLKIHANRMKCNELKLNHSIDGLHTNQIGFGKIQEVREIENRRFFNISYCSYTKNNTQQLYNTTFATHPGASKELNVSQLGKSYVIETRYSEWGESGSHFSVSKLEGIPYNLVDEGRPLIAVRTNNSTWYLLIGPDPRSNDKYLEVFEADVLQFCESQAIKAINLDETIITSELGNVNYSNFERSIKNENKTMALLPLKMKAIKRMTDEFKYLVKKSESIGTDVTISENIIFNHNEGKISYNDFSFSIDDNMVKAKLFEMFQNYLISYYRGNLTEQEIIDNIMDKTFTLLKNRTNSYSVDNYEIPIKINDRIDIKLEGKVTKSKSVLLYLNGQRFNKNEIMTVLREMTCYRSQEEANKFISNIGRLGLSVYIGISTGYEIEYNRDKNDRIIPEPEDGYTKRIFKFKKLKGRSNYELQLDGTTIPIKGKKLINMLYMNFIDEKVIRLFAKIPECILESTTSSLDYLKYKFLIDASYDNFKNKAKEFLDKKVNDLGAEYIKYYNEKKRSIMEAVKVKGASGKDYVIAYDSKDSFVFVDANIRETSESKELNTYEKGKYICMIDQSNIKSNIGYDTVVSKLLALKNDSSIAHTIYNLEEELG